MFVQILSFASVLAATGANDSESNLLTVEDARVAIAASGFVGATTGVLRIEKVSDTGSCRQIVLSSMFEEPSGKTAKLTMSYKDRSYEVVYNLPAKAASEVYSEYQLAMRNSMFIQTVVEALKRRSYRGLSLIHYTFAGQKVGVQDECDLVFGVKGPDAEFDKQYRLVKCGW